MRRQQLAGGNVTFRHVTTLSKLLRVARHVDKTNAGYYGTTVVSFLGLP